MKIKNEKRFIRIFWICVSAPFALILFLLLVIRLGAFGKLPTFEDLENPRSNIATEVISEDGQQLGSFFIQNRSFVEYDDLSPNLIAALVSTEDARFYSHSGIDFIGLTRVAVKTLALGNRGQGGGSTITQQLAKNLYPRDTSNYSSAFTRVPSLVIAKLKEWITAVMLEHNYTKDEIAVMYLNVVEYGSNAFGIKSAAHTFFNKSPKDLKIEEAAVIQGVSWWKRMVKIIFPIQKTSFLSGYLLPFISCMRELSLFILLVTPANRVLTTQLFQYNEKGWNQYANAINLLIIVVVLFFNLVINKLTGASIDKGIGGS